jgi:hypothetical protein
MRTNDCNLRDSASILEIARLGQLVMARGKQQTTIIATPPV